MNHFKNLYNSDPICWAVKTYNTHPALTALQNAMVIDYATPSIYRNFGKNKVEQAIYDDQVIEWIKSGTIPNIATNDEVEEAIIEEDMDDEYDFPCKGQLG